MMDALSHPNPAISAGEDHDPQSPFGLGELVYRQLRLSLMSGGYAPGTKLNITRIAEHYGTSVTPVREAVVQLVREGALELRTGHQPRVRVLSIEEYLDIRETRVPLERLATELAAVHITAPQLEELRKLHRAFAACEAANDWKGALATNQALHFMVYRLSRNPALVKVIENLWLMTGPFSTNQYPNIRNSIVSPHPHELLVDALARKVPSDAADAIIRDLRDGSYRLLRAMQTSGQITAASASR